MPADFVLKFIGRKRSSRTGAHALVAILFTFFLRSCRLSGSSGIRYFSVPDLSAKVTGSRNEDNTDNSHE